MPRTADPHGKAAMKLLPVVVGFSMVVAAGIAAAQSLGFISQWGGLGFGDGQFNTPVGITTDQTGKVYVTDYGNARVEIFTGDGVFLAQWSTLGHGFSTPTGVAVSLSGDVYVSEHSTNRIQIFSSDGVFLGLLGTGGNGPGQFYSPFGIAIGPDGTVYVADRFNRRVQAFTGTGTFVTQWGIEGQPEAIATDPAGRVYVAAGSVHVFTGGGAFLATYPMPSGVWPRGIAATLNRIYVADTQGHRVVEFTSTGDYIRQTGGVGIEPGQFRNPTALCVNATGHIFVTDTDNHRVQKLGDVVVPTRDVTWGSMKARYRGARGAAAQPAAQDK